MSVSYRLGYLEEIAREGDIAAPKRAGCFYTRLYISLCTIILVKNILKNMHALEISAASVSFPARLVLLLQ